MMRALLLAAALLVPTALATHGSGCSPGDGFRTAEAQGIYIYAVTGSNHGNYGVWQESNDINGLQRYDVVFDETCAGHYPPDTELFTFYMI